MNSHMVGVTTWLFASPPGSRPGGALERIKVRGSTLVLTSRTLTLPSPKPTPLPSLTLARPSLPAGERRESNAALIV